MGTGRQIARKLPLGVAAWCNAAVPLDTSSLLHEAFADFWLGAAIHAMDNVDVARETSEEAASRFLANVWPPELRRDAFRAFGLPEPVASPIALNRILLQQAEDHRMLIHPHAVASTSDDTGERNKRFKALLATASPPSATVLREAGEELVLAIDRILLAAEVSRIFERPPATLYDIFETTRSVIGEHAKRRFNQDGTILNLAFAVDKAALAVEATYLQNGMPYPGATTRTAGIEQ